MNIENVICKACHPGNFLSTNLFRKWSVFCCLNFCLNRFSRKLENATAIPIYLATEKARHLNKSCHYWISFNDNLSSGSCGDNILAYRLWEISERILIQTTGQFDSLLAEGDMFSSYTALSAPESEAQENDVVEDTRDLLEIV